MVWRVVYSAYNIPPPTNITNMFNSWLRQKLEFALEFQLFLLRYEIVEIILYLIGQETFTFCSLSIWLLTGFSNRRSSFRRITGILWLGYTWLLVVAQDIFSRASWQHISRLRNALLYYVVIFLLVDSCFNLIWSVMCKL